MISLQLKSALTYRSSMARANDEKVILDATSVGREGQRISLDLLVDTGAPWCIFDPSLRPLLAEGEDEGDIPKKDAILLRGYECFGPRVRLPLTFGDPDSPHALTIEATVLFPVLHPDDTWPYPNFLGLSALSRLCWGLEPSACRFYFGPDCSSPRP